MKNTAIIFVLIFSTHAFAKKRSCQVRPSEKVCINDSIDDWIFGGLNTLSELDLTKVCMWHKGSKIIFEMEARRPGFSGFSSNPRYFDLFILSPKIGGFVGFYFHEDLVLDKKDGWQAPCLVEAYAESGGLGSVESVDHYAHDGKDHKDFKWAHMDGVDFRTKIKSGVETLEFIVPKKAVCRDGNCHFKFTATSSEHSNDFDDDRVATREVCFD
jgi:hypothetical protein